MLLQLPAAACCSSGLLLQLLANHNRASLKYFALELASTQPRREYKLQMLPIITEHHGAMAVNTLASTRPKTEYKLHTLPSLTQYY